MYVPTCMCTQSRLKQGGSYGSGGSWYRFEKRILASIIHFSFQVSSLSFRREIRLRKTLFYFTFIFTNDFVCSLACHCFLILFLLYTVKKSNRFSPYEPISLAFKTMRQTSPLFHLFSSFSHRISKHCFIFNILKKQRWCAWDLNPGHRMEGADETTKLWRPPLRFS